MSPQADGRVLVGVLSDTHGSLVDGILQAFSGVDAIVHAGDIGPATVLDELSTIAPVTAVRGNCDSGAEHWRLGTVERVTIADVRFVIVHDLDSLPDTATGADVIVCGHTHAPSSSRADGLLVFNPGCAKGATAGTSTVGILEISDGVLVAERFVAVPDPHRM